MCECSSSRSSTAQRIQVNAESTIALSRRDAHIDTEAPQNAPDNPVPKAVLDFMAPYFWPGTYTIVDPTLTSGNCHGLTFGAGGDTSISIQSIEGLLEVLGWDGDWVNDESENVLICMEGDEVGHSALKDGAGWRQTLPNGPTFITSREVLQSKYEACFDLSNQGDRMRLRIKLQEKSAQYVEARNRLIALCDPHTKTGDKGLDDNYRPIWKQQAEKDALDIGEITHYIQQIQDASRHRR